MDFICDFNSLIIYIYREATTIYIFSILIFSFLKRFCLFIFFLIFIGEIIIRVFYLSPDIPQREIDKNGIQKFKLNQTGKYNSKLKNWIVNDYGWLGVAQTNRENSIYNW